jgi:hypothetical protein
MPAGFEVGPGTIVGKEVKDMEDRERKSACRNISRREFVKKTSKAAVGMALGLSALEKLNVPGHLRDNPRVVRAYNPDATWWDYESDYYFDFVDQEAVDRMFLDGVQVLMDTGSDFQAWSRLFPGNRRESKIAIKINCNNQSDRSNEIDATAPVINAVLLGLCETIGVLPENIYVYDCSRPVFQWRIRDRVLWEVNYVQIGDELSHTDYSAPIEFRRSITHYCPYVLTQSDYLVNLCLFKDHARVLSTMGFKNHFGTVRPDPLYLHRPIQFNLGDLNATPHIREKTRLTVGDTLWAIYDGGPSGWPQQWETFPGGPTPNSIFLGQDPVATESVMIDYLIAEQEYRGIQVINHNYLHDAMEYHGLGVHEHRNEHGEYQLIDYVQILSS